MIVAGLILVISGLVIIVTSMKAAASMGEVCFGVIVTIAGFATIVNDDGPQKPKYAEACINGTTYYDSGNALAPAYINDKLVKCEGL